MRDVLKNVKVDSDKHDLKRKSKQLQLYDENTD